MIKAVLFDLDGTLLPMDQEAFTKGYFKELARSMYPLREAEELISSVWAGTKAMIRNDGKQTNETVFWNTYAGIYGEEARADEPRFAEFYGKRFGELSGLCGKDPAAGPLVHDLRAAGYTLAAATNPLFPMTAQHFRLGWAGTDRNDFSWITSYENSSFCKPSAGYYLEVLEKIGARPEEALMVGNDIGEDMEPAAGIGMQVFLITACMINREGKDISGYPQGGFDGLRRFIAENGAYPLRPDSEKAH